MCGAEDRRSPWSPLRRIARHVATPLTPAGGSLQAFNKTSDFADGSSAGAMSSAQNTLVLLPMPRRIEKLLPDRDPSLPDRVLLLQSGSKAARSPRRRRVFIVRLRNRLTAVRATKNGARS